MPTNRYPACIRPQVNATPWCAVWRRADGRHWALHHTYPHPLHLPDVNFIPLLRANTACHLPAFACACRAWRCENMPWWRAREHPWLQHISSRCTSMLPFSRDILLAYTAQTRHGICWWHFWLREGGGEEGLLLETGKGKGRTRTGRAGFFWHWACAL